MHSFFNEWYETDRVLVRFRVAMPFVSCAASNRAIVLRVYEMRNVLYWGEKYKTRSITDHITHNNCSRTHIRNYIVCTHAIHIDVKLKGFFFSFSYFLLFHQICYEICSLELPRSHAFPRLESLWMEAIKMRSQKKENRFESEGLFQSEHVNRFRFRYFPISICASFINHCSCSFD